MLLVTHEYKSIHTTITFIIATSECLSSTTPFKHFKVCSRSSALLQTHVSSQYLTDHLQEVYHETCVLLLVPCHQKHPQQHPLQQHRARIL